MEIGRGVALATDGTIARLEKKPPPPPPAKRGALVPAGRKSNPPPKRAASPSVGYEVGGDFGGTTTIERAVFEGTCPPSRIKVPRTEGGMPFGGMSLLLEPPLPLSDPVIAELDGALAQVASALASEEAKPKEGSGGGPSVPGGQGPIAPVSAHHPPGAGPGVKAMFPAPQEPGGPPPEPLEPSGESVVQSWVNLQA